MEELEKLLAQCREQHIVDLLKLEELTDFVENASIPLHWVNAEGIITWANQAELDALGYRKEDYIGKPIANFHADQEVITDILTRLTNNDTLKNYPARLLASDGSIRHVLISSNVLQKNGKFIHTRCFTKDVTTIVLKEQAQAMLAAIIQSTDDAIISKTLEGTITSWNPSAQRIFGYSETEMLGRPITTLFPADRQDEELDILAKLRKGERVEHFETKRMRKDGSLVDVSLTISPIRDHGGNIIGLSKIARDITLKKQEEQRKNDFVAMVSHELKTPLTSISAYVQILLAKAKQQDNAFNINALTKTNSQTQKMISMIRDFLTLARMEEGKILIQKTEFPLHRLIEEVTEDAQFLTKTHQIKIFNCEQVIIEADRDKLGQVMTNLLSNAIKYSPKGGQIVIGCQKQDGRLKISVSDQGIGIAGQDHKKLFERFYRVSNDSSRSASGFGIGLYLSAEILRLHDSQFHLLSELGKGSTFYFYLDEKSVLSQ